MGLVRMKSNFRVMLPILLSCVLLLPPATVSSCSSSESFVFGTPSQKPGTEPVKDTGTLITLSISDDIPFEADEGEVTLSCLLQVDGGWENLGRATTRSGGQVEWDVIVHDDEVDLVRCKFSWTWMKKVVEYTVLDDATLVNQFWSVTEAGLVQHFGTNFKLQKQWSDAP